jgi:hypothetical protein
VPTAEGGLNPVALGLALFAASLPLLLLVERIARWGVDAPVIDQWSLVDDLDKYSRGAWTIDDLLRSHAGHRLLLTRLVLVPLAFLTGWNVRVEMFLEVAFAASTFALFAWALRRALGAGPTFAACFVLASIATFSLSQWENWMWGFQLNIALAVFFSVLALTLMSGKPSWPTTALALAAAVLATFSQAGGLTIWPAGIVPILGAPMSAGSRFRRLAIWGTLGAAVIIFYVWPRPGDIGAPRPSPFVLAHPFAYLAFVLTALGGPVVSFTGATWPPRDAGVAGFVALAGLGVLAFSWRALRDHPDVRRGLLPLLGAAFWSAGVAAQIGLGRAEAGRSVGMASRYMGLTTPFWVAVIGLLGAVSLHRPRLRTGARVVLAALGGSLLVSSLWNVGAFEARWRMVWPVLAEARRRGAPDSVLAALHPDVGQVRDRIPVLRRLRLSFFREGYSLPVLVHPLTTLEQSLEVRPPLPRFAVAGVARLRVAVKNPTGERWSALGRGSLNQERSVRLSYHWLSPGGAVVVREGLRTDLPRDLLGGEQVELEATVKAPEDPGSFTLRLTMVQEGVAWFDDAPGGTPLDLVVDVAPGR